MKQQSQQQTPTAMDNRIECLFLAVRQRLKVLAAHCAFPRIIRGQHVPSRYLVDKC